MCAVERPQPEVDDQRQRIGSGRATISSCAGSGSLVARVNRKATSEIAARPDTGRFTRTPYDTAAACRFTFRPRGLRPARAARPKLRPVEVAVADDESIVPELVSLINRAYAKGEAGLWRDDIGRTDEAEIAEAVRAGHMLVATVDGRIAGCLRTRSLDASTSEVGLIGVDPDGWGGGIGRALVSAAENRARSGGADAMRLELLVPRTGTHPGKERLRGWYTRRGYSIVGRVPMEEYLPHVAPLLSAPGDILVFEKPL